MTKRERTAVAAVAKQLSATCEEGRDGSGAYITVDGKRIAVDLATLGNADMPRLRFDKVATRLIERLQAALRETVPDGTTVLVTVTAPIRLPSETAASLEDTIRTLLEGGSGPDAGDESRTIHGNHVRIRFLKNESRRGPKLIGFVHNSDSDPLPLFDMTRELLGRIGDARGSGSLA